MKKQKAEADVIEEKLREERKKYFNREHTRVWKPEKARLMPMVGKEKAMEGAGKVARKFMAELRNRIANGEIPDGYPM